MGPPALYALVFWGLRLARFDKDFGWYNTPMCEEAFPQISQEQFEYVKKRFAGVTSAVEGLLRKIEGSMTHE